MFATQWEVAARDATARDAAAKDVTAKDVSAKDVVGMTWKHVCDIPAPEGVGGLAISADGRLVAHSSGTHSVITDVATGRVLLDIPGHPFEQATFHPSGEWLAIGHPACDLISLNTEPHWRRVVEKPKPGAEWRLAKVARMLKTDIEALIEENRRFQENLPDAAPGRCLLRGSPPVAEARVAKYREKQATKLAQMRADWAAMQRGEPPPPEPVQGTYWAGFSRDGRWYWRGTAWGLFVYEWSAIGLAESAELPEPTWRFDLPSFAGQPFEIVYAIEEERDAAAVVFGGMNGRLYRLSLESGDVRELIKLPSECHILSLTFSGDGSTLAVVAQAYPLSEEAPEIGGTIWEVWNYRLLRDRGAGTEAAN